MSCIFSRKYPFEKEIFALNHPTHRLKNTQNNSRLKKTQKLNFTNPGTKKEVIPIRSNLAEIYKLESDAL